MSNMWNEELMEQLYSEAYDELVADGMSPGLALEEKATEIAQKKFAEDIFDHYEIILSALELENYNYDSKGNWIGNVSNENGWTP